MLVSRGYISSLPGVEVKLSVTYIIRCSISYWQFDIHTRYVSGLNYFGTTATRKSGIIWKFIQPKSIRIILAKFRKICQKLLKIAWILEVVWATNFVVYAKFHCIDLLNTLHWSLFLSTIWVWWQSGFLYIRKKSYLHNFADRH